MNDAAARRWFAFRLSTLVLAVWTIAAAGLIWWRWEPWVFEYDLPGTWQVISEDHRYLILNVNGELRVWDLRSASSTKLLNTEANHFDATVSARLQRIVTIEDSLLKLWDLRTTRLIGQMDVQSYVPHAVPLINDQIAICEGDHWEVWRFGQGHVRAMAASRRADRLVHCSPNGTFVVSGPNVVWNATTSQTASLPGELRSNISIRDQVLITDDYGAFIYDLQSASKVCELTGTRPAQIRTNAMGFSDDGNFIIVGENTTNGIWDVRTGRVLPNSSLLMGNSLPDGRCCDAKSILTTTMEVLFTFPRGMRGYFIDNPIGDRICLRTGNAELWRRRHPEWWWGHFYRPEVWAGLALGCIWLVKLWLRLFRGGSPSASLAP